MEYLIRIGAFENIKHHLDGYVFWRNAPNHMVQVVQAYPNQAIKELLTKALKD